MSKLLFAGALLAAAAPHLLAQVRFADVRDPAGVGADFYSSQTIHGLGINWIDFDNDDRPDMFMVNGGDGDDPHLYRNNGDGTFTNMDPLLPPLPGGVDLRMPGTPLKAAALQNLQSTPPWPATQAVADAAFRARRAASAGLGSL